MKVFARDADQQRLAKRAEHRQPAQQLKVVIEGFTETDARIEHDGLGVNAGVHGFVELRGEKVSHLAHDIGVLRIGLHGPRRALHVHQHHRDFFLATTGAIAGSKPRALISLTMSAPASRAARATWCFVSIDGDRQRALHAQALNHRNHPRQFVGLLTPARRRVAKIRRRCR